MTKYLLVEDTPELRNRVANELRRPPKGAEIFVASSGVDALKTLKNEPDIDLVVLDLTLEGQMYGMEVLGKIRKTMDVPVVILTTEQDPARQVEALGRGADGYMVKSTFNSPIQIRRYLEIVLEKHRSQASNVSGHLEK